MRLGSLVAALALAPGALADCYTFGRKSNHIIPARMVLDIPEICRQSFMGDYGAGETKALCVHDQEGLRWDFEIGYGGSERRVNLSVWPCLFYMSDLLRNCEFGGHSKDGNWYYRVDPNVNACGEPTSG